jgi:hypothetical protein
LRKLNFETFDAYQQARAIELKEKGGCDQDVGLDPSALFCKVQEMYAAFMKKVRDSSSNVMHDSNSEKIMSKQHESSPDTPSSVPNKKHESISENIVRTEAQSNIPVETGAGLGSNKVRVRHFSGVNAQKKKVSFGANLRVAGIIFHAGRYQLESEAAYAHDYASKYFGEKLNSETGRVTKKLNFASIEVYYNARTQELEERRLANNENADLISRHLKLMSASKLLLTRMELFLKQQCIQTQTFHQLTSWLAEKTN